MHEEEIQWRLQRSSSPNIFGRPMESRCSDVVNQVRCLAPAQCKIMVAVADGRYQAEYYGSNSGVEFL